MSIDSESMALFREEVCELLAQLDTSLMALELQPDSAEAINDTFRVVHTLKSDCGLVGLADMEKLLHDLETLYDSVRRGDLLIDKSVMDLTFAIKDRVASILQDEQTDRNENTDSALSLSLAELLERVADEQGAQTLRPEPEAEDREAAPPRELPEEASESGESRTYRIRFAPAQPGLFDSLAPVSLLDELRSLGEARVVLDSSNVPSLSALRPNDCHLVWDIELTTDATEDAIRDVFVFLDDQSGVRIEPLEGQSPRPILAPCPAPAVEPVAEGPSGPEPSEGVLAPASPASHDASPVSAEPRPAAPKPQAAPADAPGSSPAGKPAPDAQAKADSDAPQAPKAKATKAPTAKFAAREPSQSLRVEAAKLDNLVNLVGELVIAQARLTQIASRTGKSDLTGVAEEIERLVCELRDNTLNIRMLPIGTTFSRFRRLVRDLSSELNKEIELVTEGGETELDKTVIEQLGDPLVHLLRNSMDHGIEIPEEREAAGKPRRGSIVLSARQAGGAVIIRLSDDGQGLNAERIRAKAVERGVIPHDARLSEQETFELIFSPGFSTAEKVTNVSGRGVGMDVVKRSIETLRGKVDITSTRGQGTVITISLPLTLAIIDGLQVQSGADLFIIPLTMVEECVEFHADSRKGLERNRTISLRGEIVPFVRLRETFAIQGQPPGVEQIVITRHENGRTGIAVDNVVGQQQTVIKNLGRYIGRIDGISGATINGDGSMSLILDVPQLVESVVRQNLDG
ncbi:hypothetical protein JCM15519_31000 [Fundidesulfovibrio butyratiphilus]